MLGVKKFLLSGCQGELDCVYWDPVFVAPRFIQNLWTPDLDFLDSLYSNTEIFG